MKRDIALIILGIFIGGVVVVNWELGQRVRNLETNMGQVANVLNTARRVQNPQPNPPQP